MLHRSSPIALTTDMQGMEAGDAWCARVTSVDSLRNTGGNALARGGLKLSACGDMRLRGSGAAVADSLPE